MTDRQNLVTPWSTKVFIGVGVLALLAVVAIAPIYRAFIGPNISTTSAEWNNFGTFAGGVLGPVLSMLAFFALVCTIFLQEQQLALACATLKAADEDDVCSIARAGDGREPGFDPEPPPAPSIATLSRGASTAPVLDAQALAERALQHARLRVDEVQWFALVPGIVRRPVQVGCPRDRSTRDHYQVTVALVVEGRQLLVDDALHVDVPTSQKPNFIDDRSWPATRVRQSASYDGSRAGWAISHSAPAWLGTPRWISTRDRR